MPTSLVSTERRHSVIWYKKKLVEEMTGSARCAKARAKQYFPSGPCLSRACSTAFHRELEVENPISILYQLEFCVVVCRDNVPEQHDVQNQVAFDFCTPCCSGIVNHLHFDWSDEVGSYGCDRFLRN